MDRVEVGIRFHVVLRFPFKPISQVYILDIKYATWFSFRGMWAVAFPGGGMDQMCRMIPRPMN